MLADALSGQIQHTAGSVPAFAAAKKLSIIVSCRAAAPGGFQRM